MTAPDILTPRRETGGVSRPEYLSPVDSSICMVKAVARYLRGQDFPVLGLPRFLERVAPLIDLVPPRSREALYTWAACAAAYPPEQLDRVRAADISAWVAGHFPRDRRCSAVLLGSPNGAAVHLAAALRAPYLPQTFLIPVLQRGGHCDDVVARAEGAIPGGRRLLANNPHLQIHQLHDPMNDRPQLARMDYFRVKHLRLEPAYEALVEDTLEPGGALIVVECRQTWPTTRLQERHLFQMGGVGALSVEEYLEGSDRVARFLEERGSHRREWEPPEPDGTNPESEWGFEPAWNEDLERLARRGDYRTIRLVFDDIGHLSPLVADLYAWWYRRRGLSDRRLLAECFFLLDPWWSLATGSVPYWMPFNTTRSTQGLERYLDEREPFDHIGLMLLSNAVAATGSGRAVEESRALLARARIEGSFLGWNPDRHPLDMAVMARYRPALEGWTSERPPMPEPLDVEEVAQFVRATRDPLVHWVDRDG